MTRNDLDTAVEWAAKEGWNPGLYDAEAFYTTDPNGFFMGYLNDKPVASISAVSYGRQFGFLGFYIVKPEHRSKGYGIQVWNEAIKYLTNHNIGLDGVVTQQENYKKSGFRLAYRNVRYEDFGGGKITKSNKIVKLSTLPLEQVVAYDGKLFPVSRTPFLTLWFQQPESLALGYIDKGKLKGYGMVRKCRTGYKVGPLFADNAKIAEILFSELKTHVDPKSTIYLDVPEINKAAIALVKRHKMKPMFETARMYTKSPPQIDLNKVFGVTTFELG